jgi:copper chaperone CopZ
MLPGIADVDVDVDGARVSGMYDPRAVSQAEIETALEEVGYPGTVAAER